MKFLIDECLSPGLSDLLAVAGHDSVHARDCGLSAAPDTQVLEWARREGRVLVSADADFAAFITLAGTKAPSLILFRGDFDPRAAALAARITSSLNLIESYLDEGAIVVMSRDRLRIREL